MPLFSKDVFGEPLTNMSWPQRAEHSVDLCFPAQPTAFARGLGAGYALQDVVQSHGVQANPAERIGAGGGIDDLCGSVKKAERHGRHVCALGL